MKQILFSFIFVLCCESVCEGRSKFYELRNNGREIVQLTTLSFKWNMIILSDHSSYGKDPTLFLDFYTDDILVGNWSHVQRRMYNKQTQWQRLEMRMVKEYSSSQEKLIIKKLGSSYTSNKESIHLNTAPSQVVFRWTGDIQVLVDLDGLSVISVPAADVPGVTGRAGQGGIHVPYGAIIGIAVVFLVALLFLQWRASKRRSGRGAQVISTITSVLRSRIHFQRPTTPPRPCTTRTNAVVVQSHQTTSASEAGPHTNPVVVQSHQTTSASEAGPHTNPVVVHTRQTTSASEDVPLRLHSNRRTGSTLDENGYIAIEEIANVSSAYATMTDPSHANRELDRGDRGEGLNTPGDAANSSVGQLRHAYDDAFNTTDDSDRLCGHIYETVNEIQFSKDLQLHTYVNTKNLLTSK